MAIFSLRSPNKAAISYRTRGESIMSIKLLGHRVHPMLIGFPIGLLGASIGFDAVHWGTGGERWAEISFYLLGSGIVAGLIAAPFGSLDWWGIPSNTRAKRIGLYHGATAFASVVLFAASWWARYEVPTQPSPTALVLSLIGITLLSVAGWLGGELVERLGIGVDRGAHPDSPSSLSGRVASEHAGNTSPLGTIQIPTPQTQRK
jgi:uncharacterized membrane protein